MPVLIHVTQKQVKYGHHLFVMPNNEVHGQVGQLHPGAPGIGQKMAECEQKVEIFRAKYPERYIGGSNTEVHPTISVMMQNYNNKFSKLHIRKYQCRWQPPAIYPPYVPKKQAGYGHHLVVMPKNEAHGQVGHLKPWTPGVTYGL